MIADWGPASRDSEAAEVMLGFGLLALTAPLVADVDRHGHVDQAIAPERGPGRGQSATTQFATSDGLSIAYQVVGDGPIDLVFVPGFVSHVELNWEFIFTAAFLERLLPFSRLIIMDKRGSGLSDRTLGAGTLEGRMDDIRAVMDAAGAGPGRLMGVSNGGPIASMFAASYPERVSSLVSASPAALACSRCRRTSRTRWRFVQDYWTTGLVLNTIVHHAGGPVRRQSGSSPGSSATPARPPSRWRSSRRGSESDLRPFLPMVHAPTLVLSNRDDPVIPLEQAVYLAEHIPGLPAHRARRRLPLQLAVRRLRRDRFA